MSTTDASSGRTTAVPVLARRVPPPTLAIKACLRTGELFTGALPAARHRRIHLGLLHCATDGFVELAAGPRPPGGKARFITGKDPGHFLPGGATATADWLEALLALADRYVGRGDELAVAPAVRFAPAAAKPNVSPGLLADHDLARRRLLRGARRGHTALRPATRHHHHDQRS